MYKVGLTGGIGAGKSTAARIFEELGIPVYYADKEAKRLMEEDEELTAGIKNLFGKEVYEDGRLNRTLLSEKVFNDPPQLALLNKLVHPVTIRDGQLWMQKQKSPYAIKEAALIFESGGHGELDRIIGVHAPKLLCIQRAMKRDRMSREKVIERMQHQMDPSIKMKLCDEVLNNDEMTLLVPQVLGLHEKLMQLAIQKNGHG